MTWAPASRNAAKSQKRQRCRETPAPMTKTEPRSVRSLRHRAPREPLRGDRKFADSPLEGTGFELPVRGRGQSDCRPFVQSRPDENAPAIGLDAVEDDRRGLCRAGQRLVTKNAPANPSSAAGAPHPSAYVPTLRAGYAALFLGDLIGVLAGRLEEVVGLTKASRFVPGFAQYPAAPGAAKRVFMKRLFAWAP
jgi:hypothetical protein